MHLCIQRAKNTGFYGPRNVKKTPRRKLIVKNNNISYHDPTCFLRTFSYAVALWSHLESKDPATTNKSLAGNNNLEEFPFLALPRCWLIATTSEKNSHGDTSELTWKEFARKKTQSSSWHFLIFSLVFFIKCADGWGCWRACRASSYGHNFSYFQPEEKKSNLTNFHLQALCFFSGENSFMFSFRWEQ